MKRLAEWGARKLGLELVPIWRAPRLREARKLREIFERRRIERVIDVGANEGQFYQFLRQEVAFNGEIVSFEPVPELASRLRARSASDPLWTVHECALGSTAGEATFNVAEMSVFSSFLQPLDVDPSGGGNVVARKVNVPVRTLDEVFPDPSALRRTYLKLDTQGFDLEVAKGGERCLGAIPALQTEVSFRAIYEGMPDYQKALRTFNEFGFQTADFFIVSADSDGIAYEFDCVMIRPARIAATEQM